MQDDSADQLNPVRLCSVHAARCLADSREGLRKQRVQALAVLVAFFEFIRLGAEFRIRHRHHGIPQALNFIDERHDLLELPLRMRAEHLFKKAHVASTPLTVCCFFCHQEA